MKKIEVSQNFSLENAIISFDGHVVGNGGNGLQMGMWLVMEEMDYKEDM